MDNTEYKLTNEQKESIFRMSDVGFYVELFSPSLGIQNHYSNCFLTVCIGPVAFLDHDVCLVWLIISLPM